MKSTTEVHTLIKTRLTNAGINAVDGPAGNLTTEDGVIAQAAVLWPSPGLHQYVRASGARSGRSDRIKITCVGATTNDALEVADQVEAAIGAMRLPGKGGTLRQVLATDPAPEPKADPVRVSLAVEYSIITKG